jgi:PAS domain S-box-containing protein
LEKQRLDVIFRNSSDAIFMADRSGRLVAFNPAAELLTGWPAVEAATKTDAEVFPPGDAAKSSLSAATAQVLEGGAAMANVVPTTIVTRAGSLRHVDASYAHVPASNGEGPFALAVVRDVSRQKEVERLKSDFISMVSHELRTPLAVIKGYAVTLLNSNLNLDSHRQIRFVHGINDASDRLTRLIDNLLSVSRLESGRFKLNPQTVDLAEIGRKVVTGLRSSAGARSLECVVPPDGVKVRADRDQIEQVLVNLVTNAIKYSLDGSDIVIEQRELNGPLPVPDLTVPVTGRQCWAIMSVRDNGIGIPANQVRLVFDKFYRGDAPSVRRVAGTGLGLYICRSIVEAHQGHIWVESQQGSGSTFYVALPQE